MSIYEQIYDLLVTYIFGGAEALNSFQILSATQIATVMSTFVAMLPTILFVCLIVWIVKSLWRGF